MTPYGSIRLVNRYASCRLQGCPDEELEYFRVTCDSVLVRKELLCRSVWRRGKLLQVKKSSVHVGTYVFMFVYLCM